MENYGENGINNVRQFLDAEIGDNADIHICGKCKLVFADINLFVEHKKQPCGGFLIASVKSLHQRGRGRSEHPENAISTSCEIPEPGKAQETGLLSTCTNENLTELSHPGRSSKCGTEENVILDISPLPGVELEVSSGNGEQNFTPNENPQDQTSLSTLALAATRPISKTKKSALKVGKLLKKYTCDHPGCEYASAYPKDLMRHLRIHTGEQPFQCETCKKKFNRSDKLRLHMRSHTGEKPYHCDMCEYTTSDHSSLKKHLRIHTGEKPYRCQVCPYASRNSSQLVVHLRTHTLDAPYSCKICQRTFKISTDLKRHELLHTGEKPFKCDACDYKCAFKGNLKMHFRLMHSTENMQKCAQCDFATPSRKAMRLHLKSHKPKDVACPYPDCTHIEKSLHPLSIHVITHHRDEPFKCVYCLYSLKLPLNVCKHVKHYRPSNSSLANGNSEVTVTVGELGKAVENADVVSETKTNMEEETAAPTRWKCKPRNRLSKNLKRAIVCKPLCVAHFKCHLCPAAFVREDSLRSHLRHHQSTNDSSEEFPKILSKPSEQEHCNTTDTSGSLSTTSDLNTVLEMDGFQPVLEAISDARQQVIEQALRQSGIFCLEQNQSSDSGLEADESGKTLKDDPTGELTHIRGVQSQVLATITTLGSTLPVQAGVQELDSNAAVPLQPQPLSQAAQGEEEPLVYEVQHCYLVPFDAPVTDTAQYVVQSAPGGFVQFMNSTSNADETLAEKDLNVTECHESKTPGRGDCKNRPIMPKPQADVQYLAFDLL